MIEYLILSFILISIAVIGILTTKNALRILMGIEIMLNAAALNFVAFSRIYNVLGEIFVLFILIIAAAESAIGLSIILMLYKYYKTLDLEKVREMRW